MNKFDDETKKEKIQKKRYQIIFVFVSFFALLVFGGVAYFALNKIKDEKMSDVISQDQFEGTAEISSQLQVECQNSAVNVSKNSDITSVEAEFRKNIENCKDVYFAIEGNSPFRKEGMYADLVVDIAKEIDKTNKQKAVELLKFAKDIKSWDFYLGPVSCDSQHVLDAYLESFASTEEKLCLQVAEIKSKIVPEMTNKNYKFLAKLVPNKEVVWLGVPESDVGCPEKMSSVDKIISKLAVGMTTVEEAPIQPNENNDLSLNIKLSDKENISLVFSNEKDCLKLISILVPNLEVSE